MSGRLRQLETNGSGPWGKVPLWITTAQISDAAKVLFAFYSGSDFDGDHRVFWSLSETDKALHWGKDKAKRARKELLQIEAISLEPRWNKQGRLPDEITLNFVQGAKSAPMHPPKSAPVHYGTDNNTDGETDRSSSRVRRHSPSKPLGVTDRRQECTSAPLAQEYDEELAKAEDYIARWHPADPKTGRAFTGPELVEFRRASRARKESA